VLGIGNNEEHFQYTVANGTVQNTNYFKRTENGCIKIFTGFCYMTSLKGRVVGQE